MKGNNVGLPAGYRDFMSDDAELRRRIENQFASVFSTSGFREIIPSAVEYLELYARGNQGIRERAMRFLDREDNLLALRADFTPAVARIVAAHYREMPSPVRLWYSGPVFRKTDRHRGQYQEFNQIGAELIGGDPPAADCEVLSVALECLSKSGFPDACVHVNHAGIFRGLVNSLGLKESELADVRSAIDRKDMRALGSKLEELGVHGSVRAQVHSLSRCVGDSRALASVASSIENAESRDAIASLESLAARLPGWRERIIFDLTEIDEMEYYTGVMFTFLSPAHSVELGRGGRYDSLMAEFGTDLPAVGFSFSMDRLGECA
jgi:ATP phosphoribosyltransferase regulatory subunit